MTLYTASFDMEATFTKILKQVVADSVSDINSALSKSYTCDFISQRQPVTYPSVGLWWVVLNGEIAGKNRFVSMPQVDVWTVDDPENPDDIFPKLLMSNILHKIGFKTKRTAMHVWIQPKNYTLSPGSPVSYGRKFKLELESKEGFRSIPDPVVDVRHHAATFKIEHH